MYICVYTCLYVLYVQLQPIDTGVHCVSATDWHDANSPLEILPDSGFHLEHPQKPELNKQPPPALSCN